MIQLWLSQQALTDESSSYSMYTSQKLRPRASIFRQTQFPKSFLLDWLDWER